MIGKQAPDTFSAPNTERKDVMIDKFDETAGITKALFFSCFDRCYYVTVNGRERLRSDSFEMISQFFNDEVWK